METVTAAAVFVLCSLVCWRLALLLSEDAGPGRMFQKFRAFLKREAKEHKALKKSAVHEGIECLRCSSVWVALPVAVYAYWHDSLYPWLAATGDVFLVWLGLSAAAIIWNRMFPASR